MKAIRFIVIVLLLLVLTSAGPASVFALGPGPIAYNKPGLLDYDLWLIQPDGTGDTFVPITYKPGVCDQCPLIGAQHPAWSRDGRSIAVTALVPGAGTACPPTCQPYPYLQGGYAMVVFQPANPMGTLNYLAPLGTALGGGPAAFSPDGTQLAYTDPGPGFQEYRVINLDHSNLRSITLPLGEQAPFPGIDWSPTDANTLVVSMVDRSLSNVQGNTQLALVPPVEGGILAARPLTQPPYDLCCIFSDILPTFSPNGRYVAFARYINLLAIGVTWTEIRVIDITNPGDRQGQLVLQLTPGSPTGEFLSGLSWSGDGSSLVFDRLTQFGSGSGLWIDNGSVFQLQQPPGMAPARNWAAGTVTSLRHAPIASEQMLYAVNRPGTIGTAPKSAARVMLKSLAAPGAFHDVQAPPAVGIQDPALP